jgi:protocatechuate 3,4-dioxygenase beta subunit
MGDDQARTYEGRRLPRQDEEVVDQGLAFDVVTLVSRRQALRFFGVGAAAVGLAACDSGSPTSTATASATATPSAGLVEIPDETAGPYPGDGSNGPNVLTEDGVVRSDIRSSFGSANGTAQGVPMTLELVIRDLANGGSPFAGAAVYVWQCDRDGNDSLYSDAVLDQNYLRGVQIAGDDGRVRFTSTFPACYSGRWPHIHFEVYPDQTSIADSSKVIATSQVALTKDVCDAVYATSGYESSVQTFSQVSLSSDNVFGEGGGASRLPTTRGDPASGYTVTLVVGVDTTTTPTSGQLTGDGPPPGAPGAPGGPPPTR